MEGRKIIQSLSACNFKASGAKPIVRHQHVEMIFVFFLSRDIPFCFISLNVNFFVPIAWIYLFLDDHYGGSTIYHIPNLRPPIFFSQLLIKYQFLQFSGEKRNVFESCFDSRLGIAETFEPIEGRIFNWAAEFFDFSVFLEFWRPFSCFHQLVVLWIVRINALTVFSPWVFCFGSRNLKCLTKNDGFLAKMFKISKMF